MKYTKTMINSPYINALFASAYITLIANVMYYSSNYDGVEPSVLVPIMVLSLLVFSVALMAYLFFFQSLRLYIDGRKEDAVVFFLKTIGAFAVLTLVIACIIFMTM